MLSTLHSLGAKAHSPVWELRTRTCGRSIPRNGAAPQSPASSSRGSGSRRSYCYRLTSGISKIPFFFFCIKKILIPPGIIRERKSKSPRGTTSEKLTRVGEDVEKLEPRSAKLGTEPRRTAWRFFVKLKIEFACDPAIPLLGIDPKEWKAGAQAHICPPVFTAASRTRAQR